MRQQPVFPLQSAAQFALYVRSLRRSKGLTQRELGERIGVTGARISEIEKDPGAVGLTQALRLLHVLGARAVLDVNEGGSKPGAGTSAWPGEW